MTGPFSDRIASWAKSLLQGSMHRRGLTIRRLNADERRYFEKSYDDSWSVPESVQSELTLQNPRLRELRDVYGRLDYPVCTHSIWDKRHLSKALTLPWFRGDNAYVWQVQQLRHDIRLKQYLLLKYVEERDDLRLLDRLVEDGAFGAWTFRFGERSPVSRDLLEAINEINFLDRQISLSGIPALGVLDIGAGYGRLAHRMCDALANLSRYDCVDAVPDSTFLCEYYLRFRGLGRRASAIPLHEIDGRLERGAYQLAVNIHSFSECTQESVRWWMEKVRALDIPYLLIVPNDPDALLTSEQDGNRCDFAPDIAAAGYELWKKEAVYNSDEIQDLVGVKDCFFLYRKQNAQW